MVSHIPIFTPNIGEDSLLERAYLQMGRSTTNRSPLEPSKVVVIVMLVPCALTFFGEPGDQNSKPTSLATNKNPERDILHPKSFRNFQKADGSSSNFGPTRSDLRDRWVTHEHPRYYDSTKWKFIQSIGVPWQQCRAQIWPALPIPPRQNIFFKPQFFGIV